MHMKAPFLLVCKAQQCAKGLKYYGGLGSCPAHEISESGLQDSARYKDTSQDIDLIEALTRRFFSCILDLGFSSPSW